jgi:hypothetical protein
MSGTGSTTTARCVASSTTGRSESEPSGFVTNTRDIAAWRSRLPERSAWGIVKALRACLNYAVRVELLARKPSAAVPNPEPKRREVLAFASNTSGTFILTAAKVDLRIATGKGPSSDRDPRPRRP